MHCIIKELRLDKRMGGFTVNIYDIAKLSGVSIATVSRVINDKPGVSDKAKRKVMAVIEETDFRPNQIAKSLTNQKTNVIGIVMPGVNNYFSDRIDAINKVCKQRGYSLMITANYKDSNLTSEDVDNFNLLFEKRVDGIIYFPTNVMREHKEVIRKINKKIPIVITDKEISDLSLPCVVQDFIGPTKEVMTHLLDMGHKRIAFIKGLSYDLPNMERQQTYESMLIQAGLNVDMSLVEEGAYSVESGYDSMNRIMARTSEPPTAVLAGNDHMAIGAIKALKEKGYKVPDDVSVIGYDDIEFAKYVSPSLTTVKVNQYTMGTIAATMVIDLIEGHINPNHKMTMDYEYVIRDSIKPLLG